MGMGALGLGLARTGKNECPEWTPIGSKYGRDGRAAMGLCKFTAAVSRKAKDLRLLINKNNGRQNLNLKYAVVLRTTLLTHAYA
jgi:hypothetical protein